MSTKHFIPPHGGYQKLQSYRKAEIVYDATVYFTHNFLQKKDRTIDQMVQAARSGKQNIIEGSAASGTSLMKPFVEESNISILQFQPM
jgi:hypothetical protein